MKKSMSPNISPNSSMESEGDQPSDSGNYASLPKHIPFPEVPHNSELTNEFIMFLFVLFSALMQFVHIYRTVWWLPDSYINHAINLYLIDPFLVTFIMVIVSRRFLYCLIVKFLENRFSDKALKYYKTIKCTFMAVILLILGSCTMKIYVKQNYLCLFLLLYPFLVYLLIFGLEIEPFLRTTNEMHWPGSPNSGPGTRGPYINGMPLHCCSTNPSTIRDEIELLKNDFNNRFKQIIFTSVINAYYAGFVPCFFAQNILYYDVLWATQHILFVWLGGFTMCTVFCLPAKYCDVLHRAALHLGLWSRIDGRYSIYPQLSTWSKTISWPAGSIVRHCGDVYRSSGPVTSATPGNTTHFRFYKLFNNPSLIYMVLTGIQTFFIVLQILLLCFSIEWHNILSLSFLTLTNHQTLFKIVRDYLVTQKVYAAESSIYEKLSSHFN